MHIAKTAAITGAIAITLLAALGSPNPARAQDTINPADYSSTISNSLFPLSSIGPKVLEGEDTDPDTGEVTKTRLESRVLPQTTVVAGVTVTVLEEKAFADGELIELALDYFAQHKNGDVYYFGELVDNYEDGKLKDHHGQWLAGEDGARPGVIMPAKPVVGVTYEQEIAPGIAEDKITVLAIDAVVTVPAGTYQNCVKTRDFTPLEPGVAETKWHCPGVGLVREEGADAVSELVSVARAPVAAPNTGTGPGNASSTSVATLLTAAIAATGAAGIAYGLQRRRTSSADRR